MSIITPVYILLAILIFGILIFIHEFGHFFFARIFNVTINEFAIGMGPKLISKKSEKSGIVYSWRLLPIGGFVSMAGEDEESDDANAFCNKPVWQRMIITAAGAVVNIIAGMLVMIILVAASGKLGSTVVAEFIPQDSFSEGYVYSSSEEAGLQTGDRIIKINNTRVHISNELSYEIIHQGDKPVDITVIRDGETVIIENVQFPTFEEKGVTFGTNDFRIYAEDKTFTSVLKHGYFRSVSTVKMIWESLYDLVTGKYGIEAVSGPVAVTQTLAEAATYGASQFVYLSVVISMNLGIMNLLPLPALDGGRLLFQIIELIRRKPVNRNVEGYIHFVGIILLMILMLFVTGKDIMGLF